MLAKKTQKAVGAELYRKFIHAGLGLIVAVAPHFWPFSVVVIGLLLFMVVVLVVKTTRVADFIPQVPRSTWGEIAFPLGLLLTAGLFYTRQPLAFQYGVLVLTLSDTAAALIGQAWGHHPLPLKIVPKTIEGTITFFVITFLLTMAWFTLYEQPGQHLALWSALFALILTTLEASLGKGLDNFFLPLVASLLAVNFW